MVSMNNPARFLLKFIIRNYCRDFTPEQAAREVRGVKEALADLEGEGFLFPQGGGLYRVNPLSKLAAGRFLANPKGYGFVWMTEGHQFYVAPEKTKGLSDGDLVWGFAETPRPVGRFASIDIQGVLERANRGVAAVLQGSGVGTILINNRRVTIDPAKSKGAKEGSTVLVRFEGNRWEAVVEEILPAQDDLEITNIILAKGFRQDFPPALSQPPQDLTQTSQGRIDFRDKLIFSIDAQESRDVDDAFSVESLGERGWLVGIHIADVAHWVEEGSSLDQEAFRRAISVYPVNQVLPMLPIWLSEDLCSLLPGQDRLTLSCLVEVSRQGQVRDVRFAQGLVRSRAKLSYAEADKALAGQGDRELVQALAQAQVLSRALHQQRREAGAAAINLPVPQFTISQGQVVNLTAQPPRPSAAIVVELMVLLNHAGARWLNQQQVPCLFRIHEGFQPGKEEEVSNYLALFGLPPVAPEGMTSEWLRDLLQQCKGKEFKIPVEKKLVRFMRKSRYSSVSQGHFSLAVEGYAHLSSSIRRYSDLVSHRLIRAVLNNETNTPAFKRLEERLLLIAEHCSYRERMAMDIEGETADLLKCRYMEAAREQVFAGVVLDTIPSGVFVHLDNTAEGFVPNIKISGEPWQPGQRVEVKVDRVDFRRRQMTFVPAQ
jgi:ribonuclease R